MRLSDAKHQEVLIWQERVFAQESEAVRLHLRHQVFSRDLHLCGRPHRQVALVEVDHHYLAARLEPGLDLREIPGLVLDVMPDIANEKPVDGLGKQRIVWAGQNR